MSDTQREAAVRFIVQNVFVPKMSNEVGLFLVEYTKHVNNTITLSREVGMPVTPPPPIFDYSHITEQLVQDILQLEKVYNESKKK